MGGNASDLLVRLLVDDSDLDKVEGAGEKFAKFGKGAVLAAGAVGLGAAGALTAGFIGAMDAQASQSRVAASLGLTPEESARMGSVAGGLYASNYGDSLEEVQGAVEAVMTSVAGMRDASSADLQELTGNAINFAKVFEIDVPRAAQLAGQMVSQGLVDSAGEGLDLLTRGLQSVPKALREDVLDAVDEYGGVFTQMGITGSQAMSMLVAASEKGMYGIDKTGDAVKEFTIRATDMSASTQAVYSTLGLNAEEYSNMLLAGGETASDAFNTIVLGLERIEDPQKRANSAIALFGTPLEDLGTNGIPAFLESLHGVTGGMGDVEGAASALGDSLNSSASAGWETFKRTAVQSLQEVASKALPVVQPLIGALGQFAPVIGPAVVAVGALAGAVLLANGAFKAMMFIQTLATMFSILRGATIVGTSATVAQTAAQWANNAAWLASPVTWIILAIIAAIGLLVAAGIWLYQNWGAVTDAIGAGWNWLWTNVLSPVFTAIGDVFSWIYNTIILPIVTGIMLYIGLWAAVITWLWETAISPVFGFIGAIFGWIWGNVISPTVDWISDKLNLLGLGFRLLWAGFVQPALDGIGAGLNWVWNSIISPVFNAISGAVGWVGTSIRDAFGGIGDFIGSAFNTALSVVRGPVNGIIGLVNSAIRGLNTLSVTIPDWVPAVGGQTWGLSIPTIPMLATGTITNGPMLAIVGDNPGGREVIAPYDSYVRDLQGAYMQGLSAPLSVSVGAAPTSDSVRDEVARLVDELNRRGGGDRPDGPVDLSDATIAALVAGLLAAIRSGAKRSSLKALGV